MEKQTPTKTQMHQVSVKKDLDKEFVKRPVGDSPQNSIMSLQHTSGNHAVNQMLVERSHTANEVSPIIEEKSKGKDERPSTRNLQAEQSPRFDVGSVRSHIGSHADDSPSFISAVAKDPGSRLDSGIRQDFEVALGHDLDQVRIHTGARAAKSARFMGAEAYTAGNHVVFGPGKYAPWTPSGRELLAHELAHVSQMGGRMPRSLPPTADHWEGEAELAAQALHAGTAAKLSNAPAIVRTKLDPNLKSYLQKLRALAKEPGIASQRMEIVADRIENALKGLDIQDEENFSFIADELDKLFPNRVVTEFLVRYASRPLLTSEPSPERRSMEQTEKRLQVRQPYKTGRHTPGTFFSSMLFEAFGSAVASTPVPPALTKAASDGGFFVAGVYGGMADSIEEEELRALIDKLNQSNMLTVAFPPIFMAGAAYGIAEDAVDVIKSTCGLFQGDLGLAVAAVMEVLQVLMSPEGEKYSYHIGKELGREYSQQLRDALKQNLTHFTFSLGRFIGPSIIYLVLTLAGAPQALLARAFSKILPMLKQLLKNETRLLALITRLEKRLPRLPEKKQLPAASGKSGELTELPEKGTGKPSDLPGKSPPVQSPPTTVQAGNPATQPPAPGTAKLNEPSPFARGGPLTPEERQRAERLLNQSLGKAQNGPAEVTRWPSEPGKSASKVVKTGPDGKPSVMEFEGRGEKGELIKVRHIKGQVQGRVISMEVENINALPREVRDTELARAMKAAGMGDWKSDLGHVLPSATKGAEMPYNFEPQSGKWNKAVKGKANRRTVERGFQQFLDAHPNDILKVEISRKLSTSNSLLSERFCIRDASGKALFDVEVTTRGKLIDYLNP